MKDELNTAMILAAGLGTRLKPLTDTTPKPLLKINGKPMLQLVIEKLKNEGIRKLIINTHYLSEQIEIFLKENDFGLTINISKEDKILGTGGGIKNAQKYLQSCKYFLVYNVDIVSDINIKQMFEYHISKSPLVTLAIQRRDTSRALIFDSEDLLIGRLYNGEEIIYKETFEKTYIAGFCGIHIISNDIFGKFERDNFFDIFKTYFRLVKINNKILGYDIGSTKWKDIGTKENFFTIQNNFY